MSAYAHPSRPNGVALGLGVTAIGLATVAAAAIDFYPLGLIVAVMAGLLAVVSHRFLLRWEIQVALIVLTILLIPLGRYELPGALPFNLEPYRVLVAAVAACWCGSLLVDPALRWRKVGLFGPLVMFQLAILVSLALNTDRIERYDILEEVLKAFTLMGSCLIALLFSASVIRTREQLELVVKTLVGGGAIVGLFALIQYRTGFNIFDHLGIIPVLDYVPGGLPGDLEARGGGDRVYASAQHPIALSAALVMLLPLAIYTGRRYGTRMWWAAAAIIGVAAFSTVARTGSTMLLTVLVVFIALKPREVLGLWKWALPFLIAVHFLAPGALGGLKSAFFPEGGLLAEQQSAHSATSSNRLADAGPALHEWWKHPYVGYGFGTRITEPANPKNNALILDDQWLGLLLEVGLLGTLAFVWLMLRSVRRLGRAARADDSDHGWLLAALAASILSLGIGMITFDAFGFTQVTFLLFVMIGLSVPAVRFAKAPDGRPQDRRAAAS
jgi:polysaccharide biosynthesis protein PslJ